METVLVEAAVHGPSLSGRAQLTVLGASSRPFMLGERVTLRLHTTVEGKGGRLTARLRWSGWEGAKGYLGGVLPRPPDSPDGAVEFDFDAGSTSATDLEIQLSSTGGIPSLRPYLKVELADPDEQESLSTAFLTGGILRVHHAYARPARLLCLDQRAVRIDLLENSVGCAFVESLTEPWHGAASTLPDGAVSYSPAAGFTGYDRFTATLATVQGPPLLVPVTAWCGSAPVGGEGLLSGPDDPGGGTPVRSWHPSTFGGDMPWPTPPPAASGVPENPLHALPRPINTTDS
ncbi:hypothetical protein OG785_32650 [Streptomyces sp. NBC_00006]|uniref:Ig-like domain-containing protein n=1 Tax=Streptomyces sp. NBC_00006 TaxID=2975619 RepID=UPI0022563CA8|nr:Ig-like domain-containing protein [Streptomyces sp. NBC_00006]MCX5535287.1 hypothetical protein [Streptomyces sp. NBC_00006]